MLIAYKHYGLNNFELGVFNYTAKSVYSRANDNIPKKHKIAARFIEIAILKGLKP